MLVVCWSLCVALASSRLGDEQIAAKLAAMRKTRGRASPNRPMLKRPRAAGDANDAARAETRKPLPATEIDDVGVYAVPERLRMPGAAACDDYGRHASLEQLFPGTGLADAWDERAELRTELRRALRADLFEPPADWDAKRVACATGLGAACMVRYDTPMACDRFSAAFAAAGVGLSGRAFLDGLGALCGSARHGSLIDIVPLDRRVAHSWHQDCGIPSYTVLLGFPPHDGYVGGGVFSHHVKLSHPLRPNAGAEHGAVVEFELFSPHPEAIPGELVVKPIYSKGREVWVSNDATHLHSTPDVQRRECLWRFM